MDTRNGPKDTILVCVKEWTDPRCQGVGKNPTAHMSVPCKTGLKFNISGAETSLVSSMISSTEPPEGAYCNTNISAWSKIYSTTSTLTLKLARCNGVCPKKSCRSIHPFLFCFCLFNFFFPSPPSLLLSSPCSSPSPLYWFLYHGVDRLLYRLSSTQSPYILEFLHLCTSSVDVSIP